MANQIITRVIPKTLTLSFLCRLRPLAAAAVTSRHILLPSFFRALNKTYHLFPQRSNPNWSNRPPKETILLDGCDFEHWLVIMEAPDGDPTRDEIIDGYIKTFAEVIGK